MKIEEEVIRNPPLSLNSSCHNDSLSNNCFITFQNILHMLTSIGVKFPSSFHCFSAKKLPVNSLISDDMMDCVLCLYWQKVQDVVSFVGWKI